MDKEFLELLQGMARSIEELKINQEKTNSKLDKIVADVGEVKSEVSNLKLDVIDLKVDVNDLRSQVKSLNSKVNTIYDVVVETKEDVNKKSSKN